MTALMESSPDHRNTSLQRVKQVWSACCLDNFHKYFEHDDRRYHREHDLENGKRQVYDPNINFIGNRQKKSGMTYRGNFDTSDTVIIF